MPQKNLNMEDMKDKKQIRVLYSPEITHWTNSIFLSQSSVLTHFLMKWQ